VYFSPKKKSKKVKIKFITHGPGKYFSGVKSGQIGGESGA
jgi:hypothetical protein